jgi:thiaminase
MKNKCFFLLIILFYSIQSKEFYKVEVSPKLAKHVTIINNIVKECYQYLNQDDFYLTNITRLMYCLMLHLNEKEIFIEMKGFWREEIAHGTYRNHLYIYFAYENPHHDPS